MAAAASAFHCESHRSLLANLPESEPLERHVDAIVVPGSRPAGTLQHAIDLATATGCRLVVLCSRGSRAERAASMASVMPGLRWVAADLPPSYGHPLLTFQTTSHNEVAERTSDLSTKRNLGLLLGFMVGWRSVLFLDDDIYGLSATQLARAATALGKYACHANRDTGRPQQSVFISGSALAVELRPTTPFFPQVYNEDWLFMLDDVRRGGVAAAGSARQLKYDPYEDVTRAVSEEFGDILAEGLMTILPKEPAPRGANIATWEVVLERRRAFIADVLSRTNDVRVEKALRAAEERRARVTPVDCETYVHAWQDDLDNWEKRLTRLPTGISVCQALLELGLESAYTGGDTEWSGTGIASPISTVQRSSPTPLSSVAPIDVFKKANGTATALLPLSAPESRSDTSALSEREPSSERTPLSMPTSGSRAELELASVSSSRTEPPSELEPESATTPSSAALSASGV